MKTARHNGFLRGIPRILLLSLALLGLPSARCLAQKTLVISKVDGTSITLDFNSNPKLKLEKECLLVTGKDVSFEIARRDMKAFSFEEKKPDGIQTTSQSTHIRIEGHVVHATGKEATIFDASGKCVARAGQSGELRKDMSGLPKGTYVVRTNGETLKFMNL